MRAEHIPVIVGALICLIGIAICFDAMQPHLILPRRERRRRVRTETNQTGQILVGLGVICLGAALMGRDTWKLGTVVVFAGIALLIAGAVMNREYLKEMMLFRGAARRSDKGDDPPEAKRPDGPAGSMRIR